MSRLIITAIGSRGDIAPLLGLGAGLRAAGHEVGVAAHEVFADLVIGSGLEFLPMATNLDIDMTNTDISDRRGIGWAFASPQGVRAMGEGMIAALRDVPADALLLGQLTEFAGFQLAESKGIPAVGLRFQPTSATAAHLPSNMGPYSLGGAGNRLAAEFGTWIVDRVYADVVAGFRRDLGLPAVSARELRRRRTASEWLVLHGYSPEVLPRPADWRPGLEVTGYWWPPRPIDWEPPAELVRFLADGPAPVFVGFGSMVDSAARSAEVSALVGAALRRAGVRGIVQSGWLRMDVTADDVLTIGEVPHDWLFPQMSAVVHHCGAGTAAAGLRAGVPAVGVPVYSDQPFWAQRLQALGVSAATIPHRRLSVDRLATAIRRATTDSTLRGNAIRLATRIDAEDGVGHAVRAIEARLTGVHA
ncbi:glycosyltransferase [Nocardia huaxiensis]|uniref:Glycosyltransferase family 1 protein n=1 Tax=Nocardia huaxiensis TaxID=2755382 RepID=A0A7D6ZLV5_9NOCA|nr:glycosyltransferase [Nocardia huaxiensis]QLY30483.1 glycosyltransferase family 1 protein [Nocardia huaxiensis]UFS95918.1 glycosyltransferase [Nocardia huaxiensis]